MGAVLYQVSDEGASRIVSYTSDKFSSAGAKYHSNEQECLTIGWALRKYRPMLEGGRFTLCTDNAALICLDRVQYEREKMTRWVMLLKRSSFNIEHVLGKKNELPDALSRLPGNQVFWEDPEEADDFLPPTQPKPEEENFVAVLGAADLRQGIIDGQGEELKLHDGRRKAKTFPLHKAQELRQANGTFTLFEPRNPPRLYVLRSMRDAVLRYYHEDAIAGHPGITETARSIWGWLYWPDFCGSVRRHVRAFQECDTAKRSRPIDAEPLRPRQPHTPWDSVTI
jgi:hypothetical protein